MAVNLHINGRAAANHVGMNGHAPPAPRNGNPEAPAWVCGAVLAPVLAILTGAERAFVSSLVTRIEPHFAEEPDPRRSAERCLFNLLILAGWCCMIPVIREDAPSLQRMSSRTSFYLGFLTVIGVIAVYHAIMIRYHHVFSLGD